MTGERWAQIRRIFAAASRLSGTERERYLDAECGDDTGLRREIEELLASADGADGNVESIVGEAAQALASHQEGRSIGPYRIRRVIGQGGMGQVYLAERDDAELDQQVAIKVVGWYAVTETQIERFLAERQILAGLDHPNIARLLDGGRTDDGVPYLVMEYVDGTIITRYADEAGLAIKDRLALFLKVCAAVQHAHGRLVIHRDIKPSNILVTADGTPKLLDFGIAKLLDASLLGQSQPVTRADLRVLTPEYASPEQLRGLPVTTQTDVYGLGLLLYELLTGRFPYDIDGPDSPKLDQVILEADPGLPSVAVTRPVKEDAAGPRIPAAELSRALAGDLDNIVMMALRKEPVRRYATVKELADDIGNYSADRPVAARGDSAAYRAGKFLKRNRLAVTAVVAVGIAGLLQAAFYTGRLADERDRAQLEAARATEVAGFLTDLFAEADPAQSLGEPLTARQMLDRGAARIVDELDGQPDLQAALMLTIAESYGNLEENVAAREYLELSVPQAEARLGDGHRDVLALRRLLGMARVWVGDADEARPLFEQNLSELIGEHGDDHIEVAKERRQLAVMENRLGNYEAAEAQFVDAIEALRAAGAPARGELARTLIDFGSMIRRQDRYAEEEELLLEALDIQAQEVGRKHPDYSAVVNNLGNHYLRRDRLDDAHRYMEEHVALQRELHGEGSVPYGVALVNYSSLLKRTGETERALDICRQALTIFANGYGTDAPRYAYLLENIANLETDLERYHDAEASFREALSILATRFGANHPEYAFTQRNWGVSLARMGRPEDAIPELEQAIATWQSAHGENYSRVITTRTSLADAYLRAGDVVAARDAIEAALQAARSTYPEPHLDALFAHRTAAAVYAASDDAERAETEFRASVSTGDALADDFAAETVSSEIAYAEWLAANGRADEASQRLIARIDALTGGTADDALIGRVQEALSGLR